MALAARAGVARALPQRSQRPQQQQQQQQAGRPPAAAAAPAQPRSSLLPQRRCQQQPLLQRPPGTLCPPLSAVPESVEEVADLIAAQPLDDELKASLEVLTNTLGVPLGTAKAMAFKRRGVTALGADELLSRVRTVADVVGVTTDQAIEMVTIQPGLLFDTQRNAEALALGIRAICYELDAPKDEVVALILENQSVLHGREMHLSVADIAHLAMLREPRGRIAE